MRKSKFSIEEVESAIKKLENGTSMADICKKMGVTVATVYNWKKKFIPQNRPSILLPNFHAASIQEVEQENLRLKQLVATLSLEKQDLLELLKKRT